MTDFPTHPEDLSDVIGIPLEKWPGNCHAVAQAVLDRAPIEGMRLVRGRYTGYVSVASIYARGDAGQQHSWLQLADGRILDPTRWALESPKRPFVYIGVDDAYDEGGKELGARSDAYMRSSLSALMSPKASGPEDVILAALFAHPEEHVALSDAIGSSPSTPEALARACLDALKAPYEHLLDPKSFYQIMQNIGLGALGNIDTKMRALAPETLEPPHGVNFFYEAPEAEPMTRVGRLFTVLNHFLSIEAREGIEDELDDLDLSLQDLHDGLNQMEIYKNEEDFRHLKYARDVGILPVIAGDLLGKGFGAEIRVERFARSLGLSRNDLHNDLKEFGDTFGYTLQWLYGSEARRAEEEQSMRAEFSLSPV